MKHLVRRLLHAPMFPSITLLTLAMGIGATTAVFSVVESVLLKPLPYSQPEELISVVHTASGINVKEMPVSPSGTAAVRSARAANGIAPAASWWWFRSR